MTDEMWKKLLDGGFQACFWIAFFLFAPKVGRFVADVLTDLLRSLIAERVAERESHTRYLSSLEARIDENTAITKASAAEVLELRRAYEGWSGDVAAAKETRR